MNYFQCGYQDTFIKLGAPLPISENPYQEQAATTATPKVFKNPTSHAAPTTKLPKPAKPRPIDPNPYGPPIESPQGYKGVEFGEGVLEKSKSRAMRDNNRYDVGGPNKHKPVATKKKVAPVEKKQEESKKLVSPKIDLSGAGSNILTPSNPEYETNWEKWNPSKVLARGALGMAARTIPSSGPYSGQLPEYAQKYPQTMQAPFTLARQDTYQGQRPKYPQTTQGTLGNAVAYKGEVPLYSETLNTLQNSNVAWNPTMAPVSSGWYDEYENQFPPSETYQPAQVARR